MKKSLLFSIYLLSMFGLNAQNEQVGDWIDYLPYHNVFAVAEGKDVTYGATTNGLIEYYKPDKSVTRFSKVMGLSGVGISCLAYNDLAETFFIGYNNGTIDLITNGRVITISDLQKKSIAGNKSLNNVYMDSVYAYIATGFGIIKFNMERQEFTETYLIIPNGEFIFVNDVTISNDTIFAATVQGVRMAHKNDPQITFYESWVLDSTLANPFGEYDIISSFNNKVYLNFPQDTMTDILYVKTPTQTWVSVPDLEGKQNRSIEPYQDLVLISHEQAVLSYDQNWNETNRVFNYGEGTYVNPNTAILGLNNAIWVGDRTFAMVNNPRPFWFEIINPESPKTANVDEIDIRKNQIAVAAGTRQNNWTSSFNNDGVFMRTPSLEWTQVNKFNTEGLDGIFDITTIQINPNNENEVYGGSLNGGLIEFTDNLVTNVFNADNSELKNANGVDWLGVTGLDYDKLGNLWMANSGNTHPIAVYTYEKEWISYNFANLVTDDQTGDLLVDQNEYKWVILPRGKGILLFNDNGTLDDLTDDNSTILNNATGRGGLPSADVYSIAEDNSGEIWVGTSEGVAVFYAPTSIFSGNGNYDAQQIIVEVNGYFQYLLGTETVTAIAVDGADRKWFGTKGSGVFLMSSDGTNQLHHFTSENSPLLSNFIRTIKINESTGEVLFGTDNGIIAYKGTATGEETQSQESYAYPNPVPEDYYGPIAIKGLPTNAAVRITDITGNLVFDTQAEGSQAIWNGNDMNGQRVATGIYLVFGIDTDGNESQVAKILFTK